MRLVPLLTGLLALLLVAAPVSAHHRPGHQGGPPHGEHQEGDDSPGRRVGAEHHDGSGPESGPGSSGAARWCREHFDDDDLDEPFKNRGQCVSFFARGGTLEDLDDDDGADDGDEESHGDLRITDVDIDDDGTFELRGEGAEDRVTVLIGGVSGQVRGSGEGDPDANGAWVVHGVWSCRDDDASHEARFVARDSDERDRLRASFACDDLDD